MQRRRLPRDDVNRPLQLQPEVLRKLLGRIGKVRQDRLDLVHKMSPTLAATPVDDYSHHNQPSLHPRPLRSQTYHQESSPTATTAQYESQTSSASQSPPPPSPEQPHTRRRPASPTASPTAPRSCGRCSTPSTTASAGARSPAAAAPRPQPPCSAAAGRTCGGPGRSVFPPRVSSDPHTRGGRWWTHVNIRLLQHIRRMHEQRDEARDLDRQDGLVV